VQIYRKLLSTRGEGEDDSRTVTRGHASTSWAETMAHLKDHVARKLLLDSKERTAVGSVLLSIPLSLVVHTRKGREITTTESCSGVERNGGYNVDDMAEVLWPDKVLADERYLVAAVTQLAERCGWQKGGEPLDTWLARELKAGEQTEVTDG
jgi:hypothetical protein